MARIRVTNSKGFVVIDVDVQTLVIMILLYGRENYKIAYPLRVETTAFNMTECETIEESEEDDL